MNLFVTVTVADGQLREATLGGRFPTPTVIVKADNRLSVTGDACYTVVVVTAELAGLIAIAAVGERLTSCREWWCRSRWHEKCCGKP
jgi:hypothetical protein